MLVTGMNGIPKTMSVHQPWFADVLRERLVPPPLSMEDDDDAQSFVPEGWDLPHGGNLFFRQLNHMIATLCNEDFAALYVLTGVQLGGPVAGAADDDGDCHPPDKGSDNKVHESEGRHILPVSHAVGIALCDPAAGSPGRQPQRHVRNVR